tara:strand:+ start:1087 stop:1485 length:399 start_codon:yes stop_codon:yes gene_type:complete
MFKTITIYNLETGIILRNVSEMGDDIYKNVKAGEGYVEGSYSTDNYIIVDGEPVAKEATVISEQNKKQAQINLTAQRNSLLQGSDWTQVIDNPLTDAKKIEWQTYRQTLRDLPTAYTDIESIEEVIFPTKPE